MNKPLRGFLLVPFVLACFALSPTARAVDPPPDGGYPNQNTAEADNALFDLDTSQGANNMATGFSAFASNAAGTPNTEVGLLYAATGFGGVNGELYILSPTNGAVVSDIGALVDFGGNSYGLTGLRFDSSTGVFYGATSSTSPTNPNFLVEVDPVTANVTAIGALGSRLTDIAIDPTSGNMYGVSGSSNGFYSINKTTGLASRVGNTGLSPQAGGGLAANDAGVIYGTNNMTLYTYNKNTGLATPVGNTRVVNLIDALAFDSTNILYGIEGGGGANNRQRKLVTINTTTGAATELGSSVNNLNALAFVPAP